MHFQFKMYKLKILKDYWLVIMKINTGDTLYEPMSRNTGEVIDVIEHPSGKIIKVRWRLDGQLPHDTELFYKKVKRCIRDGLYEHTSAG
jgi:hypothetical protein